LTAGCGISRGRSSGVVRTAEQRATPGDVLLAIGLATAYAGVLWWMFCRHQRRDQMCMCRQLQASVPQQAGRSSGGSQPGGTAV